MLEIFGHLSICAPSIGLSKKTLLWLVCFDSHKLAFQEYFFSEIFTVFGKFNSKQLYNSIRRGPQTLEGRSHVRCPEGFHF